jgi:RNA-directed DNA polymerase
MIQNPSLLDKLNMWVQEHNVPVLALYTETSYACFQIRKKSGKFRKICAPNESLKTAQKALLAILTTYCTSNHIHPSAVGFIVGKSVKTGAVLHKQSGAVALLNLDLKDFFDRITTLQVYNTLLALFKSYASTDIDKFHAHRLALLCTKISTLKGRTPQGAPTSPIISNLVLHAFDEQAVRLATIHNCLYTRYADDITFSSTVKIPIDKVFTQIVPELYHLCKQFHLVINRKKTRYVYDGRRMEVTGVVINPNTKNVTTARSYWRNLRAEIHQTDFNNNPPLNQLLGKIEWIKSLNPAKAQMLKTMISSKVLKSIKP